MLLKQVFVVTSKASGDEMKFPSFRKAQEYINEQEAIAVRAGSFEPDSYTIRDFWQEVE